MSCKKEYETNRVLDSWERFNKQDYDKLKASCLNNNQLFVDDLFLPNDGSLFKSRKMTNVQWKRPHEIVSDPKLFVDDASSRNVNQGRIKLKTKIHLLNSLSKTKK
jgi:hypothetical protein